MASTTHVIRGTLHWAKITGEPRMNTFTEEREWSVDVTPNADGYAEMRRIGIKDKLKEPRETDSRKEDFITFRQREYYTDPKTGERRPNARIKIVNAAGEDWNDNTAIGNGSVADVKFMVKDNGRGRPKGVYIKAVRVLQHVPYETQEFAPLSTDDEFFGDTKTVTTDEPDVEAEVEVKVRRPRTKPVEAEDLDDDIPF